MEVFFHGFYHGNRINMNNPTVNAELWAVEDEGRDAEYYWKNLADPKQFPFHNPSDRRRD